MGFQCGIVGLPNVGKSTLFNTLTQGKADAANYPFCTIEPNTGVVRVPDARLEDIAAFVKPDKIVPTTMQFVDIAGLVKGASLGEGLGNQFLGHIREVQAIAHVVRCFTDPNVVHVSGRVDPLNDIAVIYTELMLADLQSLTKKIQSLQRLAKTDKKANALLGVASRMKDALDDGIPARLVELSMEEEALIQELHLITRKKVFFIANIDETASSESQENLKKIEAFAKQHKIPLVSICGKIEAEIAELDADEKQLFLEELGAKEPGLNKVIRAGYEILNLQTYFTAGKVEVRAWTIPLQCKAPQAAGVIHSDFEKGFIKAEVYHYDDLMKHKSEQGVKDAGLLRLEGKEYIVKDGDILHFRFAN
jgi:ribosome-binding ATPase